MPAKHEITRDDIIPMEQYAAERKARRRALIEAKKTRRVEVGPVCMLTFETYDTMWNQIHEMLFIEKGGAAQLEDELSAYNPLIPKGRELVATVMFEIDDPARRAALLAKLGGVEATAFIRIGKDTVAGVPEADAERTTAAGKASAVQFIHFPFTDAQVAAFRRAGAPVVLGFTHSHYGHMAAVPEATRAALAEDFD